VAAIGLVHPAPYSQAASCVCFFTSFFELTEPFEELPLFETSEDIHNVINSRGRNDVVSFLLEGNELQSSKFIEPSSSVCGLTFAGG
jgi:hypothetical protein